MTERRVRTNRKQAHLNLEQSRIGGRLAALMENLPDHIYFKDLDGRFTMISTSLATAFGLHDPSEAVGRTDSDFFTENHAGLADRDERGILSSGRPILDSVERETWPDGRETWVSTTKMLHSDAHGDAVGTFGVSRDVTERTTEALERERLTEALVEHAALLEASEQRLRTALSSLLEGVAIASAIRDDAGEVVDFRFDLGNQPIAHIGGIDPDALVGHTLLELFPGHRANGLFESYRRIVETGLPFEVDDFHYVDPDAAGGPLDQYLDIRAARLGDGYVVSVRDITERRAAAEQLRESEYFFRETQRAASIGSYRAAFAEDRWESSETLDTIFGIDAAYPRTVAGWLDLVHPDGRADMERYLLEDVIQGRQRFAKEYRIVRPSDGATRWVSGLGAVGVDPDGHVVTLAGTVQDVTARRVSEAEMRRLSTAVEQSAETVLITNAAREIEYVNPAWERSSGYTRDEVCGQSPRILDSGVHGREFWADMWATLEAGATFTGEFTNRRKNGSLYLVEAVISPISEAGEAITGYVNVSRDVTLDRSREAALVRLAGERELIAGALSGVQSGPTPEATATSICSQLLRMSGVTSASLLYFGRGSLASPLAVVRADGVLVRSRPLPAARGRVLRERAAAGPWAEAWVNRPWHPFNKSFREIGVSSLGVAPIRDNGALIGVLEITMSEPDGVEVLTEHLPALLEFAGLAGALIGSKVAGLSETASVRGRIESIIRFGAFRSVYQPIVDVSTGAFVGYEALTRFTVGLAPDKAFADARTVGLEVDLELATLARAIESAAVLPRAAWLSLNVSPDLLMDAAPKVAHLLRGAHRPVVLEITEHVRVKDYAALLANIGHIRPKVRVSVDDAGAGVANFNHIMELHPDFVKLDLGIIRGIDADRTRQALVVGLIHFAKDSNAAAIAEGVETEEELAMLRGLGVTLVQGYLLARPAPAEDWS